MAAAVLAVLIFALLFALAMVQAASDAIFASAADEHSIPAHVPMQTGVTIYRAIATLLPAPYVTDMLARGALAQGDLVSAQSYALRLPVSPNRSDLLGRIALARGDDRAAQQWFLRAGDFLAVEGEVHRLALQLQPAKAFALESRLNARLKQGGTHPDAVAESYWQLGRIAVEWNRQELAMVNFRQAATLSPLTTKYLISAGFEAYVVHADSEARRDFQRAISADPDSGDAYAGAGMVALRQGDRAAALAYAAHSRALDPNSHAFRTLQALLR